MMTCLITRFILREDFTAVHCTKIAHWLVAGKERRKLEDFGYWYEPDGRSEERQRDFEKLKLNRKH